MSKTRRTCQMCDNAVYGRGFCAYHYKSFFRTGDDFELEYTLTWQEVTHHTLNVKGRSAEHVEELLRKGIYRTPEPSKKKIQRVVVRLKK